MGQHRREDINGDTKQNCSNRRDLHQNREKMTTRMDKTCDMIVHIIPPNYTHTNYYYYYTITVFFDLFCFIPVLNNPGSAMQRERLLILRCLYLDEPNSLLLTLTLTRTLPLTLTLTLTCHHHQHRSLCVNMHTSPNPNPPGSTRQIQCR